MAMEALYAIFYGTVLQNSVAGAWLILFILLFRKVTERLSKGFIRILWILLLAELLVPPLLHGPLYTMRNLAMAVQMAETDERALEAEAEGQADAGALQAYHIPWPEGSARDAALREDGRKLPRADGMAFLKKLSLNVRAAVPAMWLVGVMILCAIYLRQFFWLRKKTADAVLLPEDGCWVAEQVGMPFVMPCIPPRIYLPESLSASQRAEILAHER